MKKRLLLFVSIAFILNACIKNNPDPAWIEVNEWTIQANPELSGAEGELSHNISDAWVYVNDDLIGVFQVPFKIPVLKSGQADIKIYPTVRNNGISATKKIYPFMDVYEISANLVQNQTLVINPVTKYKSGLNFWIEDFEDANMKIVNDPNTSAAHIHFANSNLQWFNGNAYGEVLLNSTDSTWIAYTNEQLVISKGLECYLEVDYHVTNNLTTGLIYVNANGSQNNINIRLNAQADTATNWKKIYIDLKELITASPTNTSFLQSFAASLDEGKTNSKIQIDNIKVIHF